MIGDDFGQTQLSTPPNGAAVLDASRCIVAAMRAVVGTKSLSQSVRSPSRTPFMLDAPQQPLLHVPDVFLDLLVDRAAAPHVKRVT